MSSHIREASEIAQNLDKLDNELRNAQISYQQLSLLLERIRTSCGQVLRYHYGEASKQYLEDRLWDAHTRVNAQFRNALRQLKERGNAKAVERRKLSTDYLKFLKASQRFYRTFVHDLALARDDIPVLAGVAQKLNTHEVPATAHSTSGLAAFPVTAQVLLSCHRSLIQLGDLSRYRASELEEDQPNWAPSVGFYDLARSILPSSGISFNQMAIVALSDDDLFRATYYLFRALSTENPHPQATSNLRKAFYKISAAWDNGQLKSRSTSLVAWYLRLVSKCFNGKPFTEHEELEDEVLSQLQLELRKPTCANNVLFKLVITTIAAGGFAAKRFQDKPEPDENLNSYVYFLQLNLRLCRYLLGEFITGLAGWSQEKAPNVDSSDASLGVALPLAKVYLEWLMTNVMVMVHPVAHTIDKIKDGVWMQLKQCAKTLLNCYSIPHSDTSECMMTEDEDTLGFQPVLCENTKFIWYDAESNVRPLRPDIHAAAESRADILTRIQTIAKMVFGLASDNRTPLSLEEGDLLCLQKMADNSGLLTASAAEQLHRKATEECEYDAVRSPDADVSLDATQVTLGTKSPQVGQILIQHSEDEEAERMVSSLVDDVGTGVRHGASSSRRRGQSGVSSATGGQASSIDNRAENSTSSELLLAAKQSAHRRGSSASPQSQTSGIAPTAWQQTARPSHVRQPSSAQSPSSVGATPVLRPATLPTPPSALPHGPLGQAASRTHSRMHSTSSVSGSPIVSPPASASRLSINDVAPMSVSANIGGGIGSRPYLPAPNDPTIGTVVDATNSAMATTLLFGAGHSPWSMTGGESSRRWLPGAGYAPANDGVASEDGAGAGKSKGEAVSAVDQPWT